MNIFEMTLRKMLAYRKDIKYINGVAYGAIDNEKLFKIQLVAKKISEHYEDIEVSIINKNEGIIDKTSLSFLDLLPNEQFNRAAHIWKHNGKFEWFEINPSVEDFEEMNRVFDDYIGLFINQEQDLVSEDFKM